MNTLKLHLFDTTTATFAPTPVAAANLRTQPQPLPASLWRQSLDAMDHAATGPALRFSQVCFALLGTLSAGSVVLAATTLYRCLGSHDGLHAAVHTFMSR